MGKRSNTKESIILASAELFYNKGFVETTFSDISKQVGISQPALYAHYKNKMDLLKNLSIYAAEECRLEVKKKVNLKDPAELKLKTYIMANLNFFKKRKELSFAIMAIYFFASSSKEIKDVFTFVQEKSIDQIEVLVTQLGFETNKKYDDTRALSKSIHSLMVGDSYKVILAKSDAIAKKTLASHWPVIQKLL